MINIEMRIDRRVCTSVRNYPRGQIITRTETKRGIARPEINVDDAWTILEAGGGIQIKVWINRRILALQVQATGRRDNEAVLTNIKRRIYCSRVRCQRLEIMPTV
jgi:sorbitol-specific phosphotransferase system component IIBC